jgi:hypothetical protein
MAAARNCICFRFDGNNNEQFEILYGNMMYIGIYKNYERNIVYMSTITNTVKIFGITSDRFKVESMHRNVSLSCIKPYY